MIKPWHLLPVLAASALAASAYWWHAEKDRWTPPVPLKPDLPKVEPLPQHERVRARQALERPVLWTSRRPVEVDDKKNSQAREITQSRLTAVFESGPERVAILQRADGSTLKVTSDSKPWRIESFDGRKATFVSADDGRVVRPLEAGNPPAAKTPPPGPVADRGRKPAASQ
jgi:hypothetical protein